MPAYDEVQIDTAATVSKIVGRILAVLIAITIPLTTLFLASNLVFRIPDIYSLDLSRTMITDKLDIGEDASELSELISDYMMNKTDSFYLRGSYQGRVTSIFTNNDALSIERYREILDSTMTAAWILLFFSIAAYIAIYQLGRKRALRNGYTASLIVYFGIIIGWAWIMFDETSFNAVRREILGVTVLRSDVLPRLFATGFRLEAIAVIFIVSLILMLLGNALTRYLTKGYKMFKKEE